MTHHFFGKIVGSQTHCVCVVQIQSWHGKQEVKETVRHFEDLILDLAEVLH